MDPRRMDHGVAHPAAHHGEWTRSPQEGRVLHVRSWISEAYTSSVSLAVPSAQAREPLYT